MQFISNLHSETNHRKGLRQKGKEKEERKGGREKTRDWFPTDIYLDSVSLS